MSDAVAGAPTRAALSRLITAAAKTVECPVAVFYRPARAMLEPLVWAGVQTPAPYVEVNRLWRCGANAQRFDIRVANDACAGSDWPVPAFESQGRVLRFAAAVPVADADARISGVLLIGDWQARAGLSPAQGYALRAYAARIQAYLGADGIVIKEPSAASGWPGERLRLLESIVAHAKEAVLVTQARPIDEPGPRIVYCNAAFTQTTGYTEAEVLGKTPRLLQHADTDRAALDRVRAALVAQQPVEVELLNQRKDGRAFWVELSIVPVADDSGTVTHWVSVQRDVSERRRVEEVANEARIAQAEKIALEARLEERKRIEATLAHAAYHDDLTQLRNRAYVMDRLATLVDAGARTAGGYVLFMDLDRFKLVNDSLGHRAGDLLLMEVARRLERCLRSGDVLARVGGDEFVIVQHASADEPAATALAERIITQMQKPFHVNGHDIFSSCSIGIVEFAPGYASPEELLRDADIAMYAAKFKGAGQYALFTESMRAEVVEALALQNDLKHALGSDQLYAVYQPIRALDDQRLYGVEALARWDHPERGAISPSVFIPVAEEIGVVSEIGAWLMHETCAQVACWNARWPARALVLSVNVSARELTHREFVPRLRSILDETGLAPERLQLEVTETLFLQDERRVSALIEHVRSLGVRVALDDFGTGYSSLGYIDRYEIDAIKIDRSFVERMLDSQRTMAIVRMIVALGRELDFDIVAEGVASARHLERVRALRCPLGQGEWLGEPMRAAAVERLLERG